MNPPGDYHVKGLVSELDVMTSPYDGISEETARRIVLALEEDGKLPWRSKSVSEDRMQMKLLPGEWEVQLDGKTYFCWLFQGFMRIGRRPLEEALRR